MTPDEYYTHLEKLWEAVRIQGATHVAFNCEGNWMVLSHNSLVVQEAAWPHANGHEVAVEMSATAAKVHRGYYAMMTRLMK